MTGLISLVAHLLLMWLAAGFLVTLCYVVASDVKDTDGRWWRIVWNAPLRELFVFVAVAAILAPVWPLIAWAWMKD